MPIRALRVSTSRGCQSWCAGIKCTGQLKRERHERQLYRPLKAVAKERETYVKYREEAVRLSAGMIDSELRVATTQRIKALDQAIASVDQALKITHR